MDKENKTVKLKSRIPRPKDPLPPLPHITTKKLKMENERQPLKTLSWQTVQPNTTNVALKSEMVNLKPKCPLKVDTRHVTLRQNTEDLDWNYHVFKDGTVQDSSVIIISDDEDNVKEENEAGNYFVNNQEKNCLGETKDVLTPALKSPSLEPNRIKNIKRSLKRPHSRELQGLSPIVKKNREDERHKRRLEFIDPPQHKQQSPDFRKKSYMSCLNKDYTDDLFTYLLNVENKTAKPRITSTIRACIINWLIKVNGLHGNPAVIQSALWYLDTITRVSLVQINSLQVVAVACYWIAQKIHGPAYSARKLVNYTSEAFSCRNLLAAEKAVLYKLKFPSQPVIPHEFITYLSWWCDNCHPSEIEVAATFLCLSGMMVDKELCNEWPSVIAAAAVRNAVLLLGKKEAMVRLHMNTVYTAAQKKTTSISLVCSIQRKAVRRMSSAYFKFKTLLEYYSIAPHCIAQKIILSANELSLLETHTKC